MQLLSGGAEGGTPIFFVHGNVSSSRYFEETLAALPSEAGTGASPPISGGFRRIGDEAGGRHTWSRGLLRRPLRSGRRVGAGGREDPPGRLVGGRHDSRALCHGSPGYGVLADPRKPDVPLRVRGNQGCLRNSVLAGLCWVRRRDDQPRVRTTPEGRRPQRGGSELPPQRNERLLLQAPFQGAGGEGGGSPLLHALHEGGGGNLSGGRDPFQELAERGAGQGRHEQRHLAQILCPWRLREDRSETLRALDTWHQRRARLGRFASGLRLPRTTGGGTGVAGGGSVPPAADALPDTRCARGVRPERGELPGRSDRRLRALTARREARGVPTGPLQLP